MFVRFWGTRGSIAKAGPTTIRYGGNTSCVELRSKAGTLVVLDCGTGAHGLGRALLDQEDGQHGALLVGHTHWDHIQGLPFFGPLFRRGSRWDIYGPRGMGPTLQEVLAGQMQHTYFPVTLDQMGADIGFHDLVEGTFEVGDIEVTAWYLNHPALTLGYRLRADGVTVVYSTDHEPRSKLLALGREIPPVGADERHARFLEGADLVIHDAQYTAAEYEEKQGWGHSTVEYVVGTARAAGARRLALFHHDPARTDDQLDAIVEDVHAGLPQAGPAFEVFAAAEGQALHIDAQAPDPARPKPDVLELSNRAKTTPVGRSTVMLLVHDVELRKPLLQALTDGDHRCELPADVDEAWASLVASPPQLLIVERDADRAGLALCRRLRSQPGAALRKLPVVVVSHQEHPEDGATAQACGVSDFFYAPFTSAYARARIHGWLMRVEPRWRPAPLPPDENARLAALRALQLLGSGPEERFDRVTRIAGSLFDVPVALVSLVDADSQWFKSCFGMDATSTPRDQAFCAHAILDDDVLMVPDAHLDERFAGNPLVEGPPHVRFYAGVPLTLPDGARVGTLCLLDHRPRVLDAQQLDLLRDLGHMVEQELVQGPLPGAPSAPSSAPSSASSGLSR